MTLRTAYLALDPAQAELVSERPEGWASIGPGREVTPNIHIEAYLPDDQVLVNALFNPPLTDEEVTLLQTWPEWVGESAVDVEAKFPALVPFTGSVWS